MESSFQLNQQGKQFKLVKFFAYASFVVLIIFSFPFSVLISQKAKDILMERHENYALLLGENLNHQVFQNFVIPVTRRFGRIRLREERQYQWMDKIVRNTIHSFKVDLVNVYDIGKGIIAYSTNKELLGRKVPLGLGYEKAVKGQHSSRLISEAKELWGLNIDLPGGQKKLRTFIPFRGMDPFTGEQGPVLGVFEIIQDLTEEYKSLERFQYTIFGLSIVIMALIFLALLFIVHKAERILDERARKERELHDQLHQAERLAALGQMVAGISHEIRNPLGIIRSTAELLESLPNVQDSQKRLCSVIIEESTRLDNIITEFLDFARPRKPNIQNCSLTEILKKNLNFLRLELEKRLITVKDNLDGREFSLKADPELLYMAFLNIFINSIHAIEGKGTITVSGNEKKDYYEIRITDTGAGIKPEHLGKVFDPFFTTKDKGTGLGLSMVRKIIEGHGGSIKIDSKEGIGTTVIVRLPRGGLEQYPG